MTHNRQFLLLIACALLAGAASASHPESQSAALPSSDRSHGIHQAHPVTLGKRKPQPYTKAAETPKGEGDTTEQAQRHAGAVSSQSKLPPQAANGRPSVSKPNSANANQPTQNRAVQGAKGGPGLREEAARDALPIRPPTMISLAERSHNDVRHRGTNPAALGGDATSKSTTTGAISGSTVHRKP